MGSLGLTPGCAGVIGAVCGREVVFTPSELRSGLSSGTRKAGVADVGGVGNALFVLRGVLGALGLAIGAKRRGLFIVAVGAPMIT
ncbi:hypothetical protein OPQ81_010166 [Rhizoctonia solani]|nr:hypothetical protein OPQ81_010166 [Rhizoctonia solani]